MGGFTRGQGEELERFLAGAGKRKQQPGGGLVAAARQAAMEGVPWTGTIPLSKLEMAVHKHWKAISEGQRRILRDELARLGFPATNSGHTALLEYCVSELKSDGREVTTVSESARRRVAEILGERGIAGHSSIYELVVHKIDTSTWQEDGLLRQMGYKVGNNGLDTHQRRLILRDLYRVKLVPGSEEVAGYLLSWGNPLTHERLDKITGSINRFIALARNQKSDYSAALADWQADIKWLKSNC